MPVPKPKAEWSHRLFDRADLMPCPFCGQSPSHILWTHPQHKAQHQVGCANDACRAMAASEKQPTFEDAVAAWSSRPTITQVVVDAAELTEALASLPDDEFFTG